MNIIHLSPHHNYERNFVLKHVICGVVGKLTKLYCYHCKQFGLLMTTPDLHWDKILPVHQMYLINELNHIIFNLIEV